MCVCVCERDRLIDRELLSCSLGPVSLSHSPLRDLEILVSS